MRYGSDLSMSGCRHHKNVLVVQAGRVNETLQCIETEMNEMCVSTGQLVKANLKAELDKQRARCSLYTEPYYQFHTSPASTSSAMVKQP